MWIIGHHWNLVFSETIVLKLLHRISFVTTEDHPFHFFNIWISCSNLIELFYEARTGIPLRLIVSIFIESCDIANKFEALADFKCYLEELRVDV